MTAALVVFWPAAFLMQGNGAQAAEVARLKREMQAIEDRNRRKGCGIQFHRAASDAEKGADESWQAGISNTDKAAQGQDGRSFFLSTRSYSNCLL